MSETNKSTVITESKKQSAPLGVLRVVVWHFLAIVASVSWRKNISHIWNVITNNRILLVDLFLAWR